jgi:Tol biopolymer transport system component/imidazolonepropionase-like amidohydrolase
MKLICLPIIFLLLTLEANAQKWNVDNPPGTSKKVTITTDEGTWMDLDVSPDGKTIVFDLLGDIYSMPAAGGKTTLLAGGKAWETQPRFSPDGKLISYTSDKDGGDNIWTMNADGSDKHAITSEAYSLLNNASWSPDGQYLIAHKNLKGKAGELWLYNRTGGEGIQLTAAKPTNKNAIEAVFSPDGKYVYWSENEIPGPNADPNKGIYAIKRMNRETGDISTVSHGTGGACRPQLSPDGKLMAFVKRIRLKSVLFLHDLSTGEEWPEYDDLSHDQQETVATSTTYPNFNWSPDSKNIIFYAKGKIWNLDITTLNTTPVPFEVTSTQNITESLHFQQKVFSDDFTPKMIRGLTTSPDGKMVAYSAAGYIYTKILPDSIPKRISATTDLEYSPAFSPDGKTLIYIDWTDELKASINTFDLKTRIVTRLTTEKGFYFTPQFSSKGDKIIYSKGTGNEVEGFAFGENTGIYTIPAAGGTPKLVIANGTNPQYAANDTKIYYQTSEKGKKSFMVMDSTGANQKLLYTSAHATQFTPSPDGKWMAFTEFYNSYITPMIGIGGVQELSSDNTTIPLTKVTREAGMNIHWSADSKKIMWSLGSRYYARNVSDALNGTTTDTTSIAIGPKLKTDVPDGKIAFKNVRIITMKGDEVLENATILINCNKISAIGKAADVMIPADAKIFDLTGKTIIPGIIDVHAHLHPASSGVSPQQDWNYYANLAYGVTTVQDPETNTDIALNQAEMVKAGSIVGPRVFIAGNVQYDDGDDDVATNNLDDIRSNLRRLKAEGAIAVETGNVPRRDQRQQIIAAARELQMEVLPEGATSLNSTMNMILDGYTGIEHNLPVWPIYKDVKTLWNASRTAYTPDLMVSQGTQYGQNYWYDRLEVWRNEYLLNFTPQYIIDARSRRRMTSEYGDYGHIDISKNAKQLADGGTRINLGSNGELEGLGSHWEMWMLAQGGMSPMEAIRSATMDGAAYLGMDKEIGSIEVGKLADMIILNDNPLDDIRNSEKIKYVMINGRLYDTDSMNEIGNREKPRLHFWWQMVRGSMISMPDGN